MLGNRAQGAALFYVSGLVAVAAVLAVVLLLPGDPRTYISLRILLLAVAVVSGFLFVAAAWRRTTDEVAREAHKSAALWGSILGLAFGFVGLGVVAVLLVPHHLVPVSLAVFSGSGVAVQRIVWMFAGALIVFSAWVICFLSALAAWWLRHR